MPRGFKIALECDAMSDKQMVHNAIVGEGPTVAIYQAEPFFAWVSDAIEGASIRALS
jgi:hypothetical protein